RSRPCDAAPRPEGCQNPVRAHAAAVWYSWIRPPSRSRRESVNARGGGGGCSGSGGWSASARCEGLAVVVHLVGVQDVLEVAAADLEAPAAKLEKEEHVEAAQADGLNR